MTPQPTQNIPTDALAIVHNPSERNAVCMRCERPRPLPVGPSNVDLATGTVVCADCSIQEKPSLGAQFQDATAVIQQVARTDPDAIEQIVASDDTPWWPLSNQ